MKTIRQIIPAQKVNMGGHILDQPLPVQGLEAIDPFLLIHHWKSELPGGQKQQDAGVGPHPHRGFSPVTFIYKGGIEHRDSRGHQAVVLEGGTQWMFAGRGITHSERFPKELVEQGGELEFIQFWVNVPGKNKMEQPFYKPLSKEETPLVKKENSLIYVVSGELDGVKGAVETYTPQLLLRGTIAEGDTIKIDVPTSYNSLLYLLDGELNINEQTAKMKDMIVFDSNHETIQITGISDTRFMLLAGEPIGEKIESYGPFVMNSQSEIMEALRDSKMGKMGVLIEEFD
jgi:redox-sensitive bicupin YhaK (pirin superfamily)